MSNNGLAPLAGPQSIAGTDLKQQTDTFAEGLVIGTRQHNSSVNA